MRMIYKKALLIAGLLPIGANCMYATFPESYREESISESLVDALWYKASHEISASIFYQQAFGDDLTVFDGTLLAYYSTGRFYGVKAALGFMLSGPFIVGTNGTHETYEDVKQIFLFNTAYADYVNEHLGLHVIAGRYKASNEWISYYTQGFGATYSNIPLTSIDFIASYGSSFVTNEYVTGFRTDLNNGIGSYLVSASAHLPHHVEIEPYIYATGFFTAFGSKAKIAYEVAHNLEMETKLHIFGYAKYYPHTFPTAVSHKFELATEAGLEDQSLAGVAWLEQEIKFYDFLEGKIGIIGVSDSGAELVDYNGHQTPFEYNVGMFWGGAFSIYGSSGFNWKHIIEVEGSIRGSFLPSGNIFSFELKGDGEFPIWRQRDRYGNVRTYMKAKVGVSVVGVYNNSVAVNFYGGDSYTLVRGFFRVSM